MHFVGGLVGSLLIGLFADADHFRTWNPELSHMDGLFYGGGLDLLLEQALANGVTIIYSGAVTALILLALKATVGIRVTDDVEVERPRPGGARRVGVLRRRGRFCLTEAVSDRDRLNVRARRRDAGPARVFERRAGQVPVRRATTGAKSRALSPGMTWYE